MNGLKVLRIKRGLSQKEFSDFKRQTRERSLSRNYDPE